MSHLGHCGSCLPSALLLLFPPILHLQPSSQMELIKNKSKHVPPLFKTLQRLPMSLRVKTEVPTMALHSDIWPPAAFLIPSSCFSPCSPCSNHHPALLAQATPPPPPTPAASRAPISSFCTVCSPCLGMLFPQKATQLAYLSPSSLCSNVIFSWRLSHFSKL